MELTDNDKQRIDKAGEEHCVIRCNQSYAEYLGFVKGAEYEHKYQREQQAELRNKLIDEVLDILNESMETTDADAVQSYFIYQVEALRTNEKNP